MGMIFKALSFMLKVTVFSVLVLMVGSWVQWDGKTISDRIKTGLAHAERSDVGLKVKDWFGSMTQGKSRKLAGAEPQDEILSSERQKLRNLIQELNSSKPAAK